MADTRSPGRLEWMLSNSHVIFLLFSGASLPKFPPNPGHRLDPDPELCLSVTRTILMKEVPCTWYPPPVESILMRITNPSSLGPSLSSVCQQDSFLLKRSEVLCHFAKECLCSSA